MKEIALTLPGSASRPVIDNPATNFNTGNSYGTASGDLGNLLSKGLELAIFAAGFFMIAWVFWGIFQYIFSGGDKAKVGEARKRITFALVGFIIVVLAFILQKFIIQIISQNNIYNPTQQIQQVGP